jgi:hypothetical protein
LDVRPLPVPNRLNSMSLYTFRMPIVIDQLSMLSLAAIAVAIFTVAIIMLIAYVDSERKRVKRQTRVEDRQSEIENGQKKIEDALRRIEEALESKADKEALRAKADREELIAVRALSRASPNRFNNDKWDFLRTQVGSPEFELALEEGYDLYTNSGPGQLAYMRRPRYATPLQAQTRLGTGTNYQ